MKNLMFIVSTITLLFKFSYATSLEKSLYLNGARITLETIYELMKDDIKQETLSIVDKIRKAKGNIDQQTRKKYKQLLMKSLLVAFEGRKEYLDPKLIDNNIENNQEIEKIIIPNLKKLKSMIENPKLKISQPEKYIRWSTKIKKQLDILNRIVQLLNIKKSQKQHIYKLIKEIIELLDSKNITI